MPALVRRLVPAALLAVIAGSFPMIATAAPIAAPTAEPSTIHVPVAVVPTVSTTAASMARTVLVLLNRDRDARGLRELVVESRLASLAYDRARWMATRNVMTHTSAGGSVGDAVEARGIRTSLAGECVGWTNATWGSTSARWLYNAWKNSPDHWALMMSPRFTRIGIGFDYHAPDQRTYGSLMFARL